MTGRKSARRAPFLSAASAALAVALLTGGCVTYTGTMYGGPDAPLRARLASTFELSPRQPSLHFAVSDRAHVALFQVDPSGHVRALYPYHPGSASSFDPGPHTVFSSALASARSWRTRPGGSFLRARSAAAHRLGRTRMTFVMVVASRAPLRLDRIRNTVSFRYRSASPLASPLGPGSAFATMDLLLDRVVPEAVADDDWAVDWQYTTIGTGRTPRLGTPTRRIVVRDGRPAHDTTAADEAKSVEVENVPFTPPRMPVDGPEVTFGDDDGEARVRPHVPLPPVSVAPDGAGADGRRPPPVVESPGGDDSGLRPRDPGPPRRPVPSGHFGRLFDDGRGPTEGWTPGRDGLRGGDGDRAARRWTREMEEWSRNPGEHAFPEPPTRPDRWRGGRGAWSDSRREFGHRERGGESRIRLRRPRTRPRIRVPRSPSSSSDIRLERPSSGADGAGDGGGSRSSTGSRDSSGETSHRDG